MTQTLWPGTKKTGVCYKGAIRDAKNRVVWACAHFHTNRDSDSYGYIRFGHEEGQSATTCARKHLRDIQRGAGDAQMAS